jgi:hypothetical protein
LREDEPQRRKGCKDWFSIRNDYGIANMIKLFISYRSLDSAKVDTLVARMKSLKNADGTPRYVWHLAG